MTQTAKRFALLPLCLVSATVVGACGAPSSGEATSTTSNTVAAESTSASATDGPTATDATATDSASATDSGTATDGASRSTAAPSSTAAPTGTAAPAPKTITVTVTATNGTIAPSAKAKAKAKATPTKNLAMVPKSRLGGCHTKSLRVYQMNLTGLNEKARQTAQTVYRAGRVCIPGNLTKVAARDKTQLANEKADPAKVFAVPQTDEARYDTILKLMGLEPAEVTFSGKKTYGWPRVATTGKSDDAAWAEVVKVGLVSQAKANEMRKAGGYWGPQIAIDSGGVWRAFRV